MGALKGTCTVRRYVVVGEPPADAVKKRLRGRYHPTMRAVDVVWNVDEKRLLLFTHNKKLAELFTDLFAKSFALTLVSAGPSWLTGELAGRAGKQLTPTPEM